MAIEGSRVKRSRLSQAARTLSKARKTHAGGAPRSDKPRCDCGVMTLKRAQTRGRGKEHKDGCAFAVIR